MFLNYFDAVVKRQGWNLQTIQSAMRDEGGSKEKIDTNDRLEMHIKKPQNKIMFWESEQSRDSYVL